MAEDDSTELLLHLKNAETGHLFGSEQEVSVLKLLRLFCNNLYLGQWEFAKACIDQLHAEGSFLKLEILDILRDIARNPHGYCLGSTTIRSSHHLSWLSLMEYEQICKQETGTLPKDYHQLSHDVQFRIMLVQIGEKTPAEQLQELYEYYRHGQKASSSEEEQMGFLSSSTQHVLSSVLLQEPALGECLLQALQASSNSQYCQYNGRLQALHIAALSGLLQEVRKLAAAAGSHENTTTQDEFTDDEDKEASEEMLLKTSHTFLNLLSKMNPDESLLDELRLTPLFRDLCNMMLQFPVVAQYLPAAALYSALMGHHDEWLLRHFCNIQYEVLRREGEAFLVVGGVTQTQKTMISTSLIEDRAMAWKNIFLLCLRKKQHFIDLIVDVSVTLILRDQLECLGRLLSPDELSPLRAVVVLMGWEHCASLDTAQRLLHTLHMANGEHVASSYSPLSAACQVLSYHVDLVQWCLEKTRTVLDESGSESSQKRGSLLFQGLGSQSVLYMLHHGDRLALLAEDEVFALLRKRPQPATQDIPVVKFVRFEGDQEESLQVEQERDMAIYRSYCILQSFMAALEFTADKANWELYSTINQRSSAAVSLEANLAGFLGRERYASADSVETRQWQAEMAAFQESYDKYVMEPLKKGQHHLSLLHPLTYRVEVLENVFSLLFVTNEHVHDAFPSDSGDEGVEESRNLSMASSPDPAAKGPATPESPMLSSPFFQPQHLKKPHVRALHLEFQDTSSRSDPQATFITDNSIFNISKADLKYGSSSDAAKKLSGNSNQSTGSTASAFNVGFLANEFFVRDVLATLKSCLQDLVSARFTMMGTHSGRWGVTDGEEPADCSVTIEMEEALMQNVHSSVEVSALQQHISSLRQHVNEATWRFELVAPDWLPVEVGSVVLDLQKLHDAHCKSDFVDIGPGYGASLRTARRHPRISLQRSVDSALSNGDSESHVSAATDCSTSGRSRSRRPRRRSSQEGESPSGVRLAKSCKGIIPHMLANKHSLLHRCLLKAAYNKAQQVVKIFKLEGQSGAAEVSFAEQYAWSVKALQKESRGKATVLGKVPRSGAKQGAKLTALKSSVASAAAAGVHSMSNTSTVDQVLGLITMSGFADSLFRIPTDVSSPLKAHICPSHLPAMVIFDLACVGSRSWEASLNLVEMAVGRLQQASNQEVLSSTADKKAGPAGMGFPPLLTEVEQLLKLGCLPEAGKDNLQTYYKRSLHNTLTTGTLPIWSATLKEYMKIINELSRDVKRVESALTEMQNCKPLHSRVLSVENLSGSRSSSVERSTSPAEAKLKVQEKPVVRNAVKWLLMTVSGLLPKMGLTTKLLGGSRSQSLHYLKSLYEHVKALSNLVEHCRGNKNLTYVEYFHMLEESPTAILGKLIFFSQMPPARLEDMAGKLHVDLTQIIVNGCCPSIPALRLRDCEPNISSPMVVNGRLVMNQGSSYPSEPRHPTVVLKEILNHLVDIMKELTLGADVFRLEHLWQLVSQGRHFEVLPLTQEITVLDLALLETREEKLSFYGNLSNLMSLHAAIHIVEEAMEQQCTGSSESSQGQTGNGQGLDPSFVLPNCDLDLMVLHNKLAYHVGQLGVVSLYELQHLVLRANCPLMRPQTGLQQARYHGIDNLDPWFEWGPPAERRLSFVLADGRESSPPLQELPDFFRHHFLFLLRHRHGDRWHGSDFVEKTSTVIAQWRRSRPNLYLYTIWARKLRVLSCDTLESQLHDAEVQYLEATVVVDLDKKQVCLPELLLSRSADFASEVEGGRPHEGLLNYMADHTEGSLQQDIQQLLALYQHSGDKNPVTIQEQNHSRMFGYTFQFNSFRTCHCDITGNLGENVPVRLSRTLSRSISQLRQTSRPENALFHLTPLTLNYLKEKDILVATLASCVSDIHSPLENISEEQTQGNICDTDDCDILKKYRGQQLRESYPVLARHIAKQSVPLQAAKNPSLSEADNPVLSLMRYDLEESIRISILSSPQNASYISSVQVSLYDLVARQHWDQSLQLFRSIPSLALQNHLELAICRDFLLCCAACPPEESEVSNVEYRWRYLLEISDPNVKARAVLGNLTLWDIETVLELLSSCLASDIPCPLLRQAVERRLQEMKVYEKITDCVHILKTKLSLTPGCAPDDTAITMTTTGTLASLEQLQGWQQIVHMSSTDPGLILDVLVESCDYTTARKWAQIHSLDPGLLEVIEASCICYLLEKDQPDYIAAFQAIEQQLRANEAGCLKLCDSLLEQLHNKNNSLFVLQFMLEHLQAELSPGRLVELQLLSYGCKTLLCLPESVRPSYSHLVEQPALLLEQLLMNMQVEWLGQVISRLQAELMAKPVTGMGFTISTIDELLKRYATKALDFPIIVNTDLNDCSLLRSQSRLSLASVQLSLADSSSVSPMSAAARPDPRAVPGHGSTSPVTPRKGTGKMPRSASAATLQAVYRLSGNAGRKISLGNEPSLASRLSGSPGGSNLLLATSPGQQTPQPVLLPRRHVMPPEAPQRSEWVPDSQVKECMVCQKERFSMFVRRHHCRRCGWVVCGDCSKRTTMIGGVSARTCDLCYQQIFKPRALEDQAGQYMVEQQWSGASPANSPAQALGGSPLLEEEEEGQVSDMGGNTNMEFILSLDEDMNDSIREEFYFEQAPSPSLCLSMLDLHSDHRSCGEIILTLCDDVSQVLKSIGPGQRNPEVDYGLVISILKHLLFNAKMKFLTGGDSRGVEECDVYLGRVDLLSLLSSADCAFLPSIQQLGREDTLRRLRDYLIEEERLVLAMEVSTKCGIEPVGVWVAMGKQCLAVGDYEAAREKFQHCLRVPVDRNVASASKLLEHIVEFLENTAPPLCSQAESILLPLRSNQDLLSEPRMKPQEESSGYDLQLKECLFYLEKYGSHAARVHFYQRHGFLTKAVHYILDKHCSVETFLEALLVPCQQTGQLARLQEQMLSADKSLERWAVYLNATCKYLIKSQWLQSLYQLQLFMKDYFRAAMTCIKHFYQAGAGSYAVLFQRVKHLHDAKQHLESYLEQQQWGALNIHCSRAPSGAEHSFRMIRSPTEVNKYINTISLQIEVTKFLNMYIDNLDAVLTSTKSFSSPTSPASAQSAATLELPSLFGSTRKKKDVVHLVLVSGNNVNDGFGLAFRIIQDFKLDYTSIYVEAGQHFAMQRKFSSIRQLLSCIRDSGLCTDQAYDEVILNSVRMLQDSAEAKEVEALIKMICMESNMISGYIFCGKLRSAYLIAVKGDRIEDVKRISAMAQQTGQTATRNICDKWLQQKGAL